MKYILLILFLWAGNISAQAIVTRTTEVDIWDEYCDSTVITLELDCLITIVGNTMHITQETKPTEIIKVWCVGIEQDNTGLWYIYEYETGEVYINTDIPFVTIADITGCIDYYNKQ